MITRNIINPNISFIDYSNNSTHSYSFTHLNRLIDAYKNLLISKGAKKGNSVVIGTQANTSQIALVLACAELGLTIVIIANPLPANQTGKQYVPGLINLKLKLMLPIDYFILDNRIQTAKFDLFNDVCRFTILIDEEQLDYTPNDVVYADKDTALLKCTSSGTTGTPKVITHTHGFLSKLIERNSKQFYGSMGMITNLAHGSSPAVYFLPGMMSKDTTQYVNLPNLPLVEIAEILRSHDLSLDHLLVPYTLFVDQLFESNESLPGCVIHTLGMIRKSWVEAVKNNRAKDIISIFGTNETSGPFMINQATDVDFDENTYKVTDDFYDLELIDDCLYVGMKEYGSVIETHDAFMKRGDKFVHVGRSNLYRINDLEINLGKYQSIIDKLLKAELVVDTKQDRIYLAIWDQDFDIHKVRHIDNVMRNDSNGLHFISKYDSLNYSDYLNGIKIDKEMLREYFRNM
jgi:hypothetical protein